MAYEILPHTADVGIAAAARTLPELFSEAARATAAVLLDDDPPTPDGSEPVDVAAGDMGGLMARFLDECLYLYETRGALAVGADVTVDGTRAVGRVLTCSGLEAEGPQIKAVTYHQLLVEERAGAWRAEVYFDV